MYKIFAILLHSRICTVVEHKIGEYQMGFRLNRSMIDNIFIIRQIYEKCHEYNIELHNVFMDFMQAFDSVNRSTIPECLKQYKVPRKLKKNNGYSKQQIRRAMQPSKHATKSKDESTTTAYIPYTASTYSRLSRMLAKHNIKSVALPPRKIASYLPPVKDALGLKTPGIYRIPCECGKVYIGQSGRSIHLA